MNDMIPGLCAFAAIVTIIAGLILTWARDLRK